MKTFSDFVLVAVSSKIQQCQLELQQTKEASHTLQGEQVVKRLKLAGLEVDAKLLAIRRGIAQEQKDKMAGSRKQVIDELVCPLYFAAVCACSFLSIALLAHNEIEACRSLLRALCV